MVKAKKDENTEQKILLAAREIFMEKGMDGARMQDIADRAGINKALLHYYFRNKEKLFETVFVEAASKFLSKVIIITTTEASLFTKIEQFVNEYISMLIENPFLPLFILNEVNKQSKTFIMKIWGNKRPPVQLFLAQVAEEAKKGNIKPIQPEQLMVNMVSMCIFPFVARPMIQWVHQMNDEAFRQFIEKRKTEVSKFIIDSIRK
jgi:TetR/AcrR family transcriptional regulator